MSAVVSVVLRDLRDKDGVRHLEARMTHDGDVIIEGQELGDGVEQIFGEGNREYEWIWTIRRANVAALARALDVLDSRILEALAERFSHPRCVDLEPFLQAHDIIVERWSRIGD